MLIPRKVGTNFSEYWNFIGVAPGCTEAFFFVIMQKQTTRIVLIGLAFFGLTRCARSQILAQRVVASKLYRFKQEQDGRFAVWIVDGNAIRDTMYPEWLYGGNGERYRFNPPSEIWIDNDISCQEYRYTLAHELCERHLMAHFAWTYNDAHDSALRLENTMRLADSLECADHEHELRPVPPIDCDSLKELVRLPARIKLHHVYLQHFEDLQDSIEVWIVDGNAVRRDIFPDFGFSGNDRAYYFIPAREIWLDNSMSCEDIKFSLLTEEEERELMSRGVGYGNAYETALHHALQTMHSLYADARMHPSVIPTLPLDRDVGTGDEASPSVLILKEQRQARKN